MKHLVLFLLLCASVQGQTYLMDGYDKKAKPDKIRIDTCYVNFPNNYDMEAVTYAIPKKIIYSQAICPIYSKKGYVIAYWVQVYVSYNKKKPFCSTCRATRAYSLNGAKSQMEKHIYEIKHPDIRLNYGQCVPNESGQSKILGLSMSNDGEYTKTNDPKTLTFIDVIKSK